jgi:hypothetical protein
MLSDLTHLARLGVALTDAQTNPDSATTAASTSHSVDNADWTVTRRFHIADTVVFRPAPIDHQIDTVHFGLLALHEEMRARYATLDSLTGERADDTGMDQPHAVVVVVDDVARLRRQLARLWHQISTELQPRTSPALHALERLQLHGRTVWIHLTTIPSTHAAQYDTPAGEGLRPGRRRGTTRRAA